MASLTKTYNADEKTYQIAFYEALFGDFGGTVHLGRSTD